MAKAKQDDDDDDDDDVVEQQQFPEMENEKIPELIAAAKRLKKIKAEIKTATSQHQDAEDKVKELMHKNNLPKYQYGKLKVDLRNKEKVVVTEDEE